MKDISGCTMVRLNEFQKLLRELSEAEDPEIAYLTGLLTKLDKSLEERLLKSSTDVEDLFLLSILDPLKGFISMITDTGSRKDLHANFIRDFTGAIATLSCDYLLTTGTSEDKNNLIKYIAYLNYAVNRIVEALTDDEESHQKFYYIVVPSSIRDVRVKDISKLSVTQNKFSILYVSEKLLMQDIQKTVSVICHEISHQVGSTARLRKYRYEKITYIIAYLLLYYATSSLFEDQDETENDEVISALAQRLSTCWEEQYIACKEEDFYLKTFREFIEATNTYTKMQIVPQKETSNLDKKICREWAGAFGEMDESLIGSICLSLNRYFGTSAFDYCCGNYDTVAQIVYRCFSDFCNGISGNAELLDEHTEYCDIVIQAFSESYCDLQMIKQRGIRSFCEYKDVLSCSFFENNSVEDELRIRSIECMLSCAEGSNRKITVEGGTDRDLMVVNNICEYLKACEKLIKGDLNILPFEKNEWLEIE